jgi:sodium/proline symporter
MAISIATFVIYLVILVGIGVVTYLRTKSYSDYNLAGRSNNKWVTAISAESSDMSGWLLMGLPGSAYAAGFSSIWIIIGLIFGTLFNWMFCANRLRIASESYGAFSITEFFEKRLNDTKGIVSLVSGIAIIVIMIINSSAEIIGSGKLLNATFGVDYKIGIIIGLAIVMIYTFLGGYMAVSWSNLVQGTLMFFALLFVPLAVIVKIGGFGPMVDSLYQQMPTFFMFTNGETGFHAFSIIVSGLGVGVCYFGVVHVLTCFMSIKNSSEIKDSTLIATIWVSLTTFGAVLIGMIGAYTFPDIADPEQVFFQMGAEYFPKAFLGLFAAAVMAAILSSVSAYVIVAASAFGANIYRRFAQNGGDEKKVVRFQRIAVILISVAAFLMSLEPDVVFAVALLATAGLGASFGPLVMFGIYTNTINKHGAVASIITGLVTVIVWYYGGLSTYIYEAIPGIVISTIVLLAVSKATGGPDQCVTEGYHKFTAMLEENKKKAKERKLAAQK